MSGTTEREADTEQQVPHERFVSGIFFDKKGKQICEYDVLKIFHFIGARRKQHHMYKWVRRNDRDELAIVHLTGPDEPSTPLRACCARDGTLKDVEIVQSRHR